jgi:hypothetical protein
MQIGADHCITLPRQWLEEMPRGMTVYTYCRLGCRGSAAYCLLKQHGWDVALLSRGMMTYHGYHKTPLSLGTGSCQWQRTLSRTAGPASDARPAPQ